MPQSGRTYFSGIYCDEVFPSQIAGIVSVGDPANSLISVFQLAWATPSSLSQCGAPLGAEYVFSSDARISYENYCEPWVAHSKNITLVANVVNNPNWGLNWKGPRTFYVNKDNIESEKEFSKISGIYDLIPAASNVSNAVVTYASSVLKYEKYLLTGYDFSFKIGEPFYSSDPFHAKNFYLNQMRLLDIYGNMVSCSHNLSFSCRWLTEYVNRAVGSSKVVNASEDGILDIPLLGKLDEELSKIEYYQRELTDKEAQEVASKTINVTDNDSFQKAKSIIADENALIKSCSIQYCLEDHVGQLKRQKDRKTKVQPFM